jgi:hypothetical protein
MEELYISLNKDRPSNLGEIMIVNAEISGEPP